MESTYRMVSSYGWAFYLIGAVYFGCMAFFMRSARNRRIFLKFSRNDSDIGAIANHCRKQTGYISAVLTRYTALITINILIFNFVSIYRKEVSTLWQFGWAAISKTYE